MMAPTATLTTLAILAGGQGTRMGRPKGELRIGDRPILHYLFDQFAWPGPTLLVTAPGREHPPGWDRFTAEAVDPVAGLGPLRGVLTALEHAPTPAVVVTTIDMPALGAAQFQWLIDLLSERPDAIGMIPRRDEQIEPFPSIFRSSAAPIVRARLEAGELSVQALSREAAVAVVPAPPDWDEIVWTNLNRPDDLAAFLKRRSPRAGR